MRYAVIAVAQQSLRLYADLDQYRHDLERFFRLAEMKHARLIIFPERTGLMVIPPLVEGFRSGLLKKADANRGRARSWWHRTRSKVMRGTARLLGADVQQEVLQALQDNAGFFWEKYVDIFAQLAYEYKITVVAGSGFFPDVNNGSLLHVATVFGPDGDILGQQAKVMLTEEEKQIAQPGTGWQAIVTPLGRLGIVFDEEVMYPEVGRVLAYQGIESLIVLAATHDDVVVRQIHDGLRARVTDNQIFGAIAFVVGADPFQPEDHPPLRGRSVIMAPHGLTPRGNGILVEAGTSAAEVLVTARWDFDALHTYWETAPIPVRHRHPEERTASLLATLYSEGVSLAEVTQALPAIGPRALPSRPEEAPAVEERAVEERAADEEQVAPTEVSEVSEEKLVAEQEEEAPAHVEPEPETAVAQEPEAPEAEEERALAVEEIPPAGEIPPVEVPPVEEEERTDISPTAEGVEPEAERVEPEAEEPAAVEIEREEEEPEESVAEAPEREQPPQADVSPPTAVQEEEREEQAEKPLAAAETPPAFAPETEEEEPPAATAQEGEEIPEHLWEQIKQELARAAETLRSLQDRATGQAPESATKTEDVTPPPSRRWFHDLVSQARGKRKGDWEEF